MKKPTKKALNSNDMIKIMESIPENDSNLQYIDKLAGEEHYRLLVWLGGQVKGKIMELGSLRGHSAFCLAKYLASKLVFNDSRSITFASGDVAIYLFYYIINIIKCPI